MQVRLSCLILVKVSTCDEWLLLDFLEGCFPMKPAYNLEDVIMLDPVVFEMLSQVCGCSGVRGMATFTKLQVNN